MKEKKLARRDRLPLSKFTKHMKFWYNEYFSFSRGISLPRYADASNFLEGN